jgi:uncharacterized membrane protein YfhO
LNTKVLPRAFAIDLKQVVQAGNNNEGIVLTGRALTKLKTTEITLYRNAEVHLQGTVDNPSMIVLTDNWHKNWKASINGQDTAIILVDGTFRGIKVPSGKYEIQMHYQPRTLGAALVCTSIIILLIIYMLIYRNKMDKFLTTVFAGPT